MRAANSSRREKSSENAACTQEFSYNLQLMFKTRKFSDKMDTDDGQEEDFLTPNASKETTPSESTDDTGVFNLSDLECSEYTKAESLTFTNYFSYWNNLLNQEAKFHEQLNALSKELCESDEEANKLRFQVEEMQRDLFARSAAMDRLEVELSASQNEQENLNQRLKEQNEVLQEYRLKNKELSEELMNKTEKYIRTEATNIAKVNELHSTITVLQEKIENFEAEISRIESERSSLENQYRAVQIEKENLNKFFDGKLKDVLLEKETINSNWKKEFEKVRTQKMEEEQQLMNDFEWKLRDIQIACKEKLVEKNKAEEEMKKIQAEMNLQENSLKDCQSEMFELKEKTKLKEQEIDNLKNQKIEMELVEQRLKDKTKKLRGVIELERENLQHMQRMHQQEIDDKDRWLRQTLEEKKTEIAIYWEEKLLQEIGRLKDELEQIYVEEKIEAVEGLRKSKDSEFNEAESKWNKIVNEQLKEISMLKKAANDREEYFHNEIVTQQTITDRDIFELRRLMDKIDNAHHERFDKVVTQHEEELETLAKRSEEKIKALESKYESEISEFKLSSDQTKQDLEREFQNKIQMLIYQHQSELDTQWSNLIFQREEAIKLAENKYINKCKFLEEQFVSQQKSHDAREIELLRTIDCLKNENDSKLYTIADLQKTVNGLKDKLQVLNQKVSNQHNKDIERDGNDLHQLNSVNKSKSQLEDLNKISDLQQIVAEQEKDIACLNEEKRYYQLQLISLQNEYLKDSDDDDDRVEIVEVDDTEEADDIIIACAASELRPRRGILRSCISIPPTIPENEVDEELSDEEEEK